MSLYPLALRRAYCLPSSLDSKAEERKYVSNVLKANGYTKTKTCLLETNQNRKIVQDNLLMYDSPRIFRLFSKSSLKNILRRSFAPENLALYKESCCGRTSHVILKWLRKTFERRKFANCKFIIIFQSHSYMRTTSSQPL